MKVSAFAQCRFMCRRGLFLVDQSRKLLTTLTAMHLSAAGERVLYDAVGAAGSYTPVRGWGEGLVAEVSAWQQR